HEAPDTVLFRPRPGVEPTADLVWIGNWGDDERSEELRAFLIEPARSLQLRGHVHGVRFPDAAISELAAAGLCYEGWIANADVPRVFARHRVTVHVPRRPYVRLLPRLPTSPALDARACRIPRVSAPCT